MSLAQEDGAKFVENLRCMGHDRYNRITEKLNGLEKLNKIIIITTTVFASTISVVQSI